VPTETLLIDAAASNLRDRVAALAPVPGYCIFIDIVGSTEMKQGGIFRWVALIHNCFRDADSFFGRYKPLKGIGDELMYYIEDQELVKSGESPLQLYDALYQIAGNRGTDYPATKIVAAHCCSAYPITFLPNVRDFYGIDVDRAARLKAIDPKLESRQLVIDSRMYEKVKAAYDQTGNKQQFDSFTKLRGPEIVTAKGIPDPIKAYRADA